MAKAPAKHFISLEQKEVVLVWTYPPIITRKTFLFLFALAVSFGLLTLLSKFSLTVAGLVSVGIFLGALILGLLVRMILNSNAFRMAIGISNREIGTGGFFWRFAIPWEEINKIQIHSVVEVKLPPPAFRSGYTPKAARPVSLLRQN